ncbi:MULTISPECIES: c-type cytochrome biogenesis protein CcmI [Halomonas]|uniref:c-type cytochrome biogenesis protein CcmI n=1 Tax=Halomonas TaxID=2745 RepID=UPI001C98C17C|nr:MULTISPECIES: c-type cytochrome biogenesis protein CcmI [Halomonas]MBY6209618.1 c-type cytochrome biogenesis protein CcmI [Halomonas sp. DP3Y7-2]MBY6226799.1 c-type cytochrome biogenesis protein CcmI [Halomonas sp. DP3Y7-1]MCA0915454.1 c-type cytochrome biogenesis protein CcmI [Halomonas denitrificans]
MTLLWLAFALLLLPAAWLLILPLRRAASLEQRQRELEANDDAAAQNVAVYRRRLASLEAARSRGDIDATRFDEDVSELKRALLDDTERLKRAPLKSAGSGKLAIPVVLLLVIVTSVVWYQREGAEGDLVLYHTIEEVRNDPAASLALMLERLEAQADRQPDNPRVWKTLYPLYRDSGAYREAGQAIERVLALEGRSPWWLGELAKMEYFTNEGRLNGRILALSREASREAPNLPSAMWFLGVEAFQQDDYQAALGYWRRGLSAADGSPLQEAMRQGVAQAEQRLAPAGQHAIRIRLSLAQALKSDRLPPSTTVFVVARDSDGKLPPLAIQRLTLAELPASITLDAGDAMSPMASLEDVDQVRLLARVSPSGQAQPQPGDLMGQREGVAVGASDQDPVTLVIDQVIE